MTDLQPRLTQALDCKIDELAKLESLSDEQLAQVRQVAAADIPPEEPAARDHIMKCLRALDAALPRRNTDDDSGRLMAETYARMLNGYSRGALNYLAREALRRCDWFPTIKQCIAILDGYQRADNDTRRKVLASNLEQQELQRRKESFIAALKRGEVSQSYIDGLSIAEKREFNAIGALRWDKAQGCFVAKTGCDNND